MRQRESMSPETKQAILTLISIIDRLNLGQLVDGMLSEEEKSKEVKSLRKELVALRTKVHAL